MKITIDVPDTLIGQENTMKFLLMDALGEFVRNREPIGMYIAERYSHIEDEKFLKRKEKDLENRIEIANCLRGHVCDVEFIK